MKTWREQAYDKGYKAYEQGKARWDNPCYLSNEDWSGPWIAGLEQAKEDAQVKREEQRNEHLRVIAECLQRVVQELDAVTCTTRARLAAEVDRLLAAPVVHTDDASSMTLRAACRAVAGALPAVQASVPRAWLGELEGVIE